MEKEVELHAEVATDPGAGVAAGAFAVDPRILVDSTAVCDLALCHVRLLDDARFPWLLLLPRRAGLTEWTDLRGSDASLLQSEILLAADALRLAMPFEKLNIGALGNIVSQLHIHVIGRHQGDAAWPGPVWGQGARVPRPPEETAEHVAQLQRALGGPGGNNGSVITDS